MKYHYEFFAYTDNLCYGRVLIGHRLTYQAAKYLAETAKMGCYIIERHRIYEN